MIEKWDFVFSEDDEVSMALKEFNFETIDLTVLKREDKSIYGSNLEEFIKLACKNAKNNGYPVLIKCKHEESSNYSLILVDGCNIIHLGQVINE